MRVLVLGGDGFCGWPTSLYLSDRGHDVTIIDNLSRRKIDIDLEVESLTPIRPISERIRVWNDVSGRQIGFINLDLATEYDRLVAVLLELRPEAIVHFAEQRAAPYSMRTTTTKRYTVDNNVRATHNLLTALVDTGIDAALAHLGTMGVYGYGWSGSAPIPEGYLTVKVPTPDGELEREILHPANPGSVYHMTKTLDQLMFAFYAKNDGLRITDLHQGIVWGTQTPQTYRDERLINRFDYDGDYGTVLNRFLMQAAIGHPLTVHGTGGQTRAFIHIRDTVRCIELAITNPPEAGDRPRVLNQITETHRVLDLAKMVGDVMGVEIAYLPNPRREAEENDLVVRNDQFLELGLQPTTLSEGLLEEGTDVAGKYAGIAPTSPKSSPGRCGKPAHGNRCGDLHDRIAQWPGVTPADRGGRAAPGHSTGVQNAWQSSRQRYVPWGRRTSGAAGTADRQACTVRAPGPIAAAARLRTGRAARRWILAVAIVVSLRGSRRWRSAFDHLLSHAGLAAALFGALGSSGVSLLGAVFLAGFLSRLVSAEHGAGPVRLGNVLRSLPWGSLIVADLLTALIVVLGFVLLIIPGADRAQPARRGRPGYRDRGPPGGPWAGLAPQRANWSGRTSGRSRCSGTLPVALVAGQRPGVGMLPDPEGRAGDVIALIARRHRRGQVAGGAGRPAAGRADLPALIRSCASGGAGAPPSLVARGARSSLPRSRFLAPAVQSAPAPPLARGPAIRPRPPVAWLMMLGRC